MVRRRRRQRRGTGGAGTPALCRCGQLPADDGASDTQPSRCQRVRAAVPRASDVEGAIAPAPHRRRRRRAPTRSAPACSDSARTTDQDTRGRTQTCRGPAGLRGRRAAAHSRRRAGPADRRRVVPAVVCVRRRTAACDGDGAAVVEPASLPASRFMPSCHPMTRTSRSPPAPLSPRRGPRRGRLVAEVRRARGVPADRRRHGGAERPAPPRRRRADAFA
jgi:hypothetical protein